MCAKVGTGAGGEGQGFLQSLEELLISSLAKWGL